MSSLYERLMGESTTRPKIPIDTFQSILGQFARAAITQQQALDAVTSISAGDDGVGVGLNTVEMQEAGDLVGLINAASGQANKLAVTAKLRDVLLLGEENCIYLNAADVRTALGVPTR